MRNISTNAFLITPRATHVLYIFSDGNISSIFQLFCDRCLKVLKTGRVNHTLIRFEIELIGSRYFTIAYDAMSIFFLCVNRTQFFCSKFAKFFHSNVLWDERTGWKEIHRVAGGYCEVMHIVFDFYIFSCSNEIIANYLSNDTKKYEKCLEVV